MKKLGLFIAMLTMIFLISACDEEVFSVTFYDFDGSLLSEVEYDEGVIPPEDPTRDGYVFDGWYTDLDYLDEYDEYDYDDILGSDLDVYAKWVPDVFTVTVDFGVGLETQEVAYTFGEEISIANPPIKKGHTLGGLYVNESLSIEFDPLNSPSQDFTVYASWIPNTVLVNYYENAPFSVHLFSIGIYNTHMVTTSGSVYAWGFNLYGMLGTNEVDLFEETDDEPINITDQFNFEDGEIIIEMSKEEHVIALTSNHRVFGWGNTEASQLGWDSPNPVMTPVDLTDDIPLDTDDYVVSVSAGFRHSVFLTNNHQLIVTGEGEYGQRGYEQVDELASFENVTDLVPLEDGETIVKAYAYSDSTLLYTSDDRVLVAGNNYFGQLGTGDFVNRYSFTDITDQFNLETGDSFIDFQFGTLYVLALTKYGNVYSFGMNDDGQLGIGSRENSNVPTLIGQDVREIHACGRNSAYIDNDGSLYMFGYIVYQLDNFDSGATGPIVEQPELMYQNFFSDYGPMSDFTLGDGLYWFTIEENEYRVYGQNNFNQMFYQYNGVLLNDFISDEFVLVHTDETVFGESYALYFPDQEITRQLTKWYTEDTLEHRHFTGSNISSEEIDLYGVWETRYYNLTIHENNINQPYIRPYEYHEGIFLDAVKPGYVLEGWYLNEELTIPFEFYEMPNQDMDVYAKWTEVQAQVITVPFDGVLTSDDSIALYEFTLDQDQHLLFYADFVFGQFVTLMDSDRNPIDDLTNLYDGYVLEEEDKLLFSELLPAGTYYIQVSRVYSFDDISMQTRISLQDYFAPQNRSLEIVFNDTERFIETIRSGSILDDLPVVQMPLLNFEGWYLDQEFTIPFNLEYMPNEDTTIYAKYGPIPMIEMTLDQQEYEGVLELEGSNLYTFTLTEVAVIEIYTISNMDTYGILYDDQMNPIRSNDDYKGLDFGFTVTLQPGTYVLEVRGLTGYESGSYTLVFTDDGFTQEVYTVSFETNGGVPIDPIQYIEGDHIEFPMTWKEGYLLEDWYVDEELTIPFDWNMPSENITLYCKWIETTALDLSVLPLTVNGTHDIEIVGYTFSLSEDASLTFDVTILSDFSVFILFTSEMEQVDVLIIEAAGTNSITATFEAGDYIIVVAGGTTDFEFTVSE